MLARNEILRIYGTEYTKNTVRLLEEADLASLIPSKSSRIGIKPNLVSPSEASFGATTHPEIVAGILEYLQSRGFINIVIAEGSWVGDRTAEAFEVCGYYSLSEKYGVPLIDAQKERSHAVDCHGMELRICDCAGDIDFLINVPVLKGHCQTKITCALKNMKGLIPNSEKRHFHAMGLHKPIAHLSCGIRQDFIVVDHICGDLVFEDGGNPVVRNCIMASRDPVLTDTLVCSLLHIAPEEVPYIPMAAALGSGSMDLASARIRTIGGDGAEDLPRERKIVSLQDAAVERHGGRTPQGAEDRIPAGRRRGSGILLGLLRLSHPRPADVKGRGPSGKAPGKGLHRPGLQGKDRRFGRRQLHLGL